jgi:hypothetical protein
MKMELLCEIERKKRQTHKSGHANKSRAEQQKQNKGLQSFSPLPFLPRKNNDPFVFQWIYPTVIANPPHQINYSI